MPEQQLFNFVFLFSYKSLKHHPTLILWFNENQSRASTAAGKMQMDFSVIIHSRPVHYRWHPRFFFSFLVVQTKTNRQASSPRCWNSQQQMCLIRRLPGFIQRSSFNQNTQTLWLQGEKRVKDRKREGKWEAEGSNGGIREGSGSGLIRLLICFVICFYFFFYSTSIQFPFIILE